MVHSASTPLGDARRTEVTPPPEIPKGLDAVVYGWEGSWRSRKKESRELWRIAQRVHAEAEKLQELQSHDLDALRDAARAKVRRLGGERWTEVQEEIMPVIVEKARRVTSLAAYPTQIMGALAIGRRKLAEMATGEGKTLTIALAAVGAGWTGRPCHIITANDYLAERDAETLSVFYKSCGLTVSSITAPLDANERRERYDAAIVYCTGKEIVADFLRDRILLGSNSDAERRAVSHLIRGQIRPAGNVLRGIHTAIVDEADNQLIDEAVTPLIISQKQENEVLREASQAAERLAASLLPGEHYEVIERFRETRLLESGREVIANWCSEQSGFLAATDWVSELANQALQARHFFLRDKQYVIMDGKVVIVDEFTGRLMPGRSWRLGLHQAVEAKEELELSAPSETIARLSFQRFYRYFRHLGGITGTGREARSECWRVYGLPFIEVPRYRPNCRKDLPASFYANDDAKWQAIVDEIVAVHAENRPVLVGTRSVSASERLARMLEQRGLLFSVLNAVRHEEEARIISDAGSAKSITIATNMAGRGTDIRISPGLAERGGLHVILTEAHESGRVDRQLCGRAGRQGDKGSSRLFASLDDELPQRRSQKWVLRIMRGAVRAKLPGSRFLTKLVFKRAQQNAEKQAERQRRLVAQQDAEISKNLLGGTLERL
ncbi:prepilin peptidase [Pelagicoccus sp. SDUM812002]|uniref:preprotein translocase subunit SecA n=1 Tax=Pelagicoccus sp. SDUM812002 TaxID=3041266 RepID=UPI00280DC6B0|nr:prepilin peptidase [Pelagicoccus sp. SDUM812002]MDQ8186506.1 prepilin peptidase [Pelagicoccus sp. SDUM812002]